MCRRMRPIAVSPSAGNLELSVLGSMQPEISAANHRPLIHDQPHVFTRFMPVPRGLDRVSDSARRMSKKKFATVEMYDDDCLRSFAI